MSESTIYNPGCDCGGAFLSGTVPPIAAQGENGDFYLDFSVYDLYGPKTAGVWPTPPVSLTGPAGVGAQGPAGPAGQQGIPGPQGAQGLQGPTGATGATGAAGAAGADGSGTTVFGSSVDPVGTDGITGDFWLNTATGFLWGPKDEFTNWVGTGFSLIGPTGATGATGPAGADGADGIPVDSHYGAQECTLNTTALAIVAAVDATLSDNADYDQVVGIWDAIPHGEMNGVTQQTNQLTINRTGVYKIAMWANVQSDVNNSKIAFKFAVNGVISIGRRPGTNLGNAGFIESTSAYGMHAFAQGDILTLWVACDKTANLTISDCVFSVNELNASEINLLLEVLDEGVSTVTTSRMDFVGAGVTVTDVGGVATVTIPGGGGASALDIQDEGVSLTTAPTLINFAGNGVVATEPVADQILVTVTDTNTTDLVVSEEGTPVVTADELNFVGSAVTVTNVAGVATVTVTDTNTTAMAVQEEGVTVATSDTINFVGAGATVTDVGGVPTVTIPGGGSALTPPLAADFTVALDGASVTSSLVDGVEGVSLQGSSTAGSNDRLSYRGIPVSGNFSLVAKFNCALFTTYHRAGITVSDGTKFIETDISSDSISANPVVGSVRKFNTVSLYGSTAVVGVQSNKEYLWVKIEDDGINLIISVSNSGDNWQQRFSEGRTVFFPAGPTSAGISLSFFGSTGALKSEILCEHLVIS